MSLEEKFTFFFRAESVFSQFHARTFRGAPLFGPDLEEFNEFKHCEQWMMYNKALLFGDAVSAQKILKTETPKGCKALGRRVSNFDEKKWKEMNEWIILEGNRLKFTQNPDLLQKLKDTNGTTLVEASPFDRLYGIGLS